MSQFKTKKNGADTEMGYCPFEHKAGLGTGMGKGRAGVLGRDKRRCAAQHGRGARSTGARGSSAPDTRARGAWARGARVRQQARGVRGTQAWARPGRAAGLWAVHLVHSTYF